MVNNYNEVGVLLCHWWMQYHQTNQFLVLHNFNTKNIYFSLKLFVKLISILIHVLISMYIKCRKIVLIAHKCLSFFKWQKAEGRKYMSVTQKTFETKWYVSKKLQIKRQKVVTMFNKCFLFRSCNTS